VLGSKTAPGMADAFTRHMQQPQQTQSGAESPPRSDQPSQSLSQHPRLGKTLAFVRRHRALSVMGAAGAGLIAGPEIALGIVLGGGIALLIDRTAARTSARRLEEEVVDTARSVRQRARHMFDAETVKQRARAVIQAVRGQIQPAPPAAGEAQKQPASETAGQPTM